MLWYQTTSWHGGAAEALVVYPAPLTCPGAAEGKAGVIANCGAGRAHEGIPAVPHTVAKLPGASGS